MYELWDNIIFYSIVLYYRCHVFYNYKYYEHHNTMLHFSFKHQLLFQEIKKKFKNHVFYVSMYLPIFMDLSFWVCFFSNGRASY